MGYTKVERFFASVSNHSENPFSTVQDVRRDVVCTRDCVDVNNPGNSGRIPPNAHRLMANPVLKEFVVSAITTTVLHPFFGSLSIAQAGFKWTSASNMTLRGSPINAWRSGCKWGMQDVFRAGIQHAVNHRGVAVDLTASLCVSFVFSPLENVRQRQIINPQNKNIFVAAGALYHELGIKRFFYGASTSAMLQCTSTALRVLSKQDTSNADSKISETQKNILILGISGISGVLGMTKAIGQTNGTALRTSLNFLWASSKKDPKIAASLFLLSTGFNIATIQVYMNLSGMYVQAVAAANH